MSSAVQNAPSESSDQIVQMRTFTLMPGFTFSVVTAKIKITDIVNVAIVTVQQS